MKSRTFNDILYSNCWEDPAIDRKAFAIGPDDTVFSISSGGCNVLTFLLDHPKQIIALDINPCQNYLLELKMAALRSFDHDTLLGFLGQNECRHRTLQYNALRDQLSVACRLYWDSQNRKIEEGIIHSGRYERYMKLLRTALTLLKGERLIRRFFESEDPAVRKELYSSRWNTPGWRLFTRVLLSRRTMTFLFDKAFFRYVGDSFSFGEHFARLTCRALTELPMRQNYFLSYVLLGKFYDDDSLPPYLLRQNHEVIRQQLDKISIVTGSCEEYLRGVPDGSISKFNFTNIFEWMSPAECETLLRDVVRTGTDRAVITYRNLLVPRERPESLQGWISRDRGLAEALHRTDLSFIYRNYVVERIEKRWKDQPIVPGQYAIAGH